jgi:hypothetical protein
MIVGTGSTVQILFSSTGTKQKITLFNHDQRESPAQKKKYL